MIEFGEQRDRKEDLRCVNLRAEVPTFLDDGRTITDSTIISQYNGRRAMVSSMWYRASFMPAK
jgi:glutathione S-transferase